MEKVLIAAAVMVALNLLKVFLSKHGYKLTEQNNAENVIKNPKITWIVGVVGILVCWGLILTVMLMPQETIVNYYEGIRQLVATVWAVFSLLGIYLLMLGFIWKIEIKEDSFVLRNSFGVKRTYPFKEVKIKELSACTRYYWAGKGFKGKDKHIVGIGYFMANYDALTKAIRAYEKSNTPKGQPPFSTQQENEQKQLQG